MIYDCFTYNGEKDVLQIRCEELSSLDVVHVMIESNYTFTGNKKELQYKHDLPICYFVDNNVPNNGNAWDNEIHQRNYILTALQQLNAKDDDVVIIADVDEIPKREIVKSYNSTMGIAAFLMDMYYYYFNCNVSNQQWKSAKILSGELLKNTTPNNIRNGGQQTELANGGWHFSWLGDAEYAMNKIKSFSHQEFNIPELTIESLKYRIDRAQGFCDGEKLKVVEVDKSFPEYLFNNQDKFSKLIFKDE